jgi:hypothetical protein
MQKKYQPFRIIPNNVEYVISTLGNNKTFTITKRLDDILIDRSNKYKKSIKDEKNKIPRDWLYGLWVNIYINSRHDFYPDPVGLNIYETKFQQWRKKWLRKLLSYF